MSTDLEEAFMEFAQSLDADWATDKDRDRNKKRLIELIENEMGPGTFEIALKRLVNGCWK